MRRPSEPMFLAKRTYRRRRLMDAARVLPFVGVFLFFMPLLWAEGLTTVVGLGFLFGAWAVLIIAVFGVSRALGRAMLDEGVEDED